MCITYSINIKNIVFAAQQGLIKRSNNKHSVA